LERHRSRRRGRRAFWKNEDWLAVWLGAAAIGGVLVGWPKAAPSFRWASHHELLDSILSAGNLANVASVALTVAVLALIGVRLMGGRALRFLAGLAVVFAMALAAMILAGNSAVHAWGLEYVIFALAIGLTVGHSLGTPGWLEEAVRTEFYIKTGLVVLGAGILFGDILQAGALGIAQAVLVVIAVWFFCFWLGRKLGVDDEFTTMLSTAVSICGVSAAIAACGAIEGDQRKLSYTTSLVLIVAVPMMIAMPWIVQAAGMPDIVGGAWLGGTLDTSGSVVAAGSLVSEPAMKAGVVVKFSQNVLIGVAALLLSVWWTVRQGKATGQRMGVGVIWQRFPKFVLGFLGASLVFSFIIDPAVAKQAKPALESLRNVWFALAFTCIGLETRLTSLVGLGGGRPALTFIGGQAFNVLWTLLIAYLLFGGLLVPMPDLQ
jgi:uncharacterized membrane protein YadS